MIRDLIDVAIGIAIGEIISLVAIAFCKGTKGQEQ